MKFSLIILLLCNLLLISVAGFTQNNNASRVININQGAAVILNTTPVSGIFFQWYRDGQVISDAINPTYNVLETGDYTVQSFNTLSCSSSFSDIVSVVVWPNTNLTANLSINKTAENKSVNINETLSYTISVENKGPNDATNVIVTDSLPKYLEFVDLPYLPNITSRYNTQTHSAVWEIPLLKENEKIDLKISTKANRPGATINKASVTATESDPDNLDNTSYASKNIYGLNFPNVFTPNNDNINDTYKISGLELYPENEFTILNRWGNHIYEKKSYQNNWTGDGLNEGTYFYVLKVKADDKWEIFKGFITLIRTKN